MGSMSVVCQNDVFEMLALQDYEPNSTTHGASVVWMLQRTKEGLLELPEFLLRCFQILVQEKAY